MEFTGKIIAVLEKKSGVSKAGNEWAKQEYVIEETSGQYPKKLCFEVFGEDKISQFNIQVGQTLKVDLNIDSREWQGRWFNQIQAWRVLSLDQQEPVGASEDSKTEDLPF